MAVDDDYSGGQPYPSYTPQLPSSAGSAPGQNSPRVNQQPRGAYPGGFAQGDYASYQSATPGREQYPEYAFPYDVYRAHPDPAIYAASSPVAPVFPAAVRSSSSCDQRTFIDFFVVTISSPQGSLTTARQWARRLITSRHQPWYALSHPMFSLLSLTMQVGPPLAEFPLPSADYLVSDLVTVRCRVYAELYF